LIEGSGLDVVQPTVGAYDIQLMLIERERERERKREVMQLELESQSKDTRLVGALSALYTPRCRVYLGILLMTIS
jgi:hypothetical protein